MKRYKGEIAMKRFIFALKVIGLAGLLICGLQPERAEAWKKSWWRVGGITLQLGGGLDTAFTIRDLSNTLLVQGDTLGNVLTFSQVGMRGWLNINNKSFPGWITGDGRSGIIMGCKDDNWGFFLGENRDTTLAASNWGIWLDNINRTVLSIRYDGKILYGIRSAGATGWQEVYTIVDSSHVFTGGVHATGGVKVDQNVSVQKLYVAKDTTLEVLVMTRTCADDTCKEFTGSDSLTAGYFPVPFATRGAITISPYPAGQAGGKLIIRRPLADTAKYDRVWVLKISQR